MKKMVLSVLFMLVVAVPAARAEHKLLITDVLEEKQLEGEATFEYLHQRGDLQDRVASANGKRFVNVLESNYSLGVGLGHGLEVTASIPYTLMERTKAEFPGLEPEYEKRDGVGDFAFGGKYLLLGGEHERFALVTGLDLKFDTAGGNNAGTRSTDVSPYLAASTVIGEHVKPYAAYRATLRSGGLQDTHTLTLGAEAELNETVTLDLKFDAAFNTGADRNLSFSGLPVNGYQEYNVELGSYLQLVHNLYLIPTVRVILTSANDTKDEALHFASATGVGGGLSLYYLY